MLISKIHISPYQVLVDAVENAEVAEIKRAVFRALTRLRAASVKEFDTIARNKLLNKSGVGK